MINRQQMSVYSGTGSSSNSSNIINTLAELDSDFTMSMFSSDGENKKSVFSCSKKLKQPLWLKCCQRKKIKQISKNAVYRWIVQACQQLPQLSTSVKRSRNNLSARQHNTSQSDSFDLNPATSSVHRGKISKKSTHSKVKSKFFPDPDFGERKKTKSHDNDEGIISRHQKRVPSELEKRRSQFCLSHSNQAYLMIANDSFEQDCQLSNEAKEAQDLESLLDAKGIKNLHRNNNNTNDSYDLNSPKINENSCAIQFKRVKARRHSSSSHNDILDSFEKFAKSNLQTSHSQGAGLHEDPSKEDGLKLPLEREPIEMQVRKWLENAKFQFNNYDKNNSDSKVVQEDVKNCYTAHPQRSTDTAPPATNRRSSRSLRQTVSCLSSDSPQLLLPSLTMDSSENTFNNREMIDSLQRRFSENFDFSHQDILARKDNNYQGLMVKKQVPLHGLYGLHSLETNEANYYYRSPYDKSSSSPVHPRIPQYSQFLSQADSDYLLTRVNPRRFMMNPFASQEISRRSSNDSQFQMYYGSNYEHFNSSERRNNSLLLNRPNSRSRTSSNSFLKSPRNPTVVRSGSAVYQASLKLDPKMYEFTKLNMQRRYSSHLKPLDAQWGNKHSLSMEAMVSPLNSARNTDTVYQQNSRRSSRLHSLSRASMVSEGYSTPGNNYENKSRFIRQHRSFCSQSGGDTPQNRKYVNFASSHGSFNSGSPHVSLSRMSIPRMPHNFLGQSSVPVSPGPKKLSSLAVLNSQQRMVQSIEYDLQNYAKNCLTKPHHQYYSAQESSQQSLGASLSENVDSPVVGRKVLQSMRTSTSSTNSITMNPPMNLLNPPDLIFSPASRRVSAVDSNQNQIDSFNNSINLKNLLRQQTIYDDIDQDDATNENYRKDSSQSINNNIINSNGNNVNTSFFDIIQRNRRAFRSASQNLDNSYNNQQDVFPDKLTRHKSAGNYSFDHNRLIQFNNSNNVNNNSMNFPNIYQHKGNISPCDNNNFANILIHDEMMAHEIDHNDQEFKLYCEDGIIEDEKEWNNTWQLMPNSNFYQPSRCVMHCPSLVPVIDASDESTSDGKSGSQPTEISKMRMNNSDQSSNDMMARKNSDHEARRKSLANLQKAKNQRQKTTTDTSFDDSFDIPDHHLGHHQRNTTSSGFLTNVCLKRPNSFTKITTSKKDYEDDKYLMPARQPLVHTASFDSEPLQLDKQINKSN